MVLILFEWRDVNGSEPDEDEWKYLKFFHDFIMHEMLFCRLRTELDVGTTATTTTTMKKKE